ncbi:hypothetical protein ACLB2K_036160 [Fragaria x ananassa]
MKIRNGESDIAAFENDIHCRLKREKYKDGEINFVYIDEVQDLAMSQIALFKYVCSNVEEGFVFSGDTAQTIARDKVVLVRDDCSREEICNSVGKQALDLTIMECKGLEFEDVLLYNFFGSSPLKNQWRVLYEFMIEKNLLDSTLPERLPSFDEARHIM